MAQVNVDLSEYDMLRTSKEKAEAEVKDLKEEIKKLKDNANNVVVKNRYYVPSLDYKAAARLFLERINKRGLEQLLNNSLYEIQMHPDYFYGSRISINDNVLQQLANLTEGVFKDFLNLKSTYVEDSITIEVRGFDEFATQIREKFELEYKAVMEEKKAQLEREIESYNVRHLDIDSAVKEATNTLNEKHETVVKKLEEQIETAKSTIKDLEERLAEASKTSEEKLAEAMVKLQAAQEEVAKYTKPKKWFNIF